MQTRPFDRGLILNIVLVMEGLLLLVATAWCYFAGIELAPLLILNRDAALKGLIVGIGMVAFSFSILGLSNIIPKSNDNFILNWIANLKEIALSELAPMFRGTNAIDIALVAITSGFCEEIFFRGVLQHEMQIWLTSVIFGLFHMPTMRHLPYGIWAFAAGFIFGSLLNHTHSLWAPIVAHGVNNFIVLMYFRYFLKPKAPDGNAT
ncbi:MAG TPA: type II CAAX endopeptidase family protein [Candidatus Obscuribacterales bacterium]